MPSKNQTVMKVNKTTLEMIRAIGEDLQKSPPKVVDLAVELFVHAYLKELKKETEDAKSS